MRDLNDSLEKEWDGSKNDPDLDILYGDLGDITFFDANTTKEQLNGIGIHTGIPINVVYFAFSCLHFLIPWGLSLQLRIVLL